MKIYTYFEEINFHEQEQLIDLWIESWRNQGFDPVVLSRIDAEKHDFYQEFITRIENIHNEILNKPIGSYGMSCYLRWLAYANSIKSNSFVSDYDVINIKLSVDQKLSDKLMFYDSCCPCFASGDAKHFIRFCHDIIDISEQNLSNLKNKNIQPWYHDQEFLVHNIDDFKSLNYVSMDCNEPTERLIQQYEHNNKFIMVDSKVIHFSHGSVGYTKEKFSEFKNKNSDELRIELIKNMI